MVATKNVESENRINIIMWFSSWALLYVVIPDRLTVPGSLLWIKQIFVHPTTSTLFWHMHTQHVFFCRRKRGYWAALWVAHVFEQPYGHSVHMSITENYSISLAALRGADIPENIGQYRHVLSHHHRGNQYLIILAANLIAYFFTLGKN